MLATPQVLDHVLLLLDSGSLMVLKYSQVVQRFYIAAEAQLAAGGALWWALESQRSQTEPTLHGSFFTTALTTSTVSPCASSCACSYMQ